MPRQTAHVEVAQMTVSQVIVRACDRCGGRRTLDEPCGLCGNTRPPEVTDLGVTNAVYANPLKAAWWAVAGRRVAEHRIARANRRTAQLQKGVR